MIKSEPLPADPERFDRCDKISDGFIGTVFNESCAHYRQIETQRKDHLNIFLLINGAIVSFPRLLPGMPQQPILLTNPVASLLLQALAAIFYLVARRNEEAKQVHLQIMMAMYGEMGAKRLTELSRKAVKKSERTGLINLIASTGFYSVTKLMLSPYVVGMAAYAISSGLAAIAVYDNQTVFWRTSSFACVIMTDLTFLVFVSDFLSFGEDGRADIN